MPLKLKEIHNPTVASIKQDDWEGSWGKINPLQHSVTTLRLCKRNSISGEETHSYPYHTLTCWRWHGKADHEELIIEAGTDVITVSGHGLSRLVDALDQGSLEILCEVPIDPEATKESPIGITAIMIAAAS